MKAAVNPPQPSGPATGSAVMQRVVIQRFTVKQRLDSPELQGARLQQAVSSAADALRVGDSHPAVGSLQVALTKAGFPVPSTGVYDAATQRAVAALQTAESIPFPTGRESGPKTLSSLDDRLLGAAPKPSPRPGKKCDEYDPGERNASHTSPGGAQRSGTFDKELRLDDFEAGSDKLKRRHITELQKLIKDFSLDDPCQEAFGINEIIGFTDAVDREEPNSTLRAFRAITVSDFLRRNGVPNAPEGVRADPTSYNHGCSPLTRSAARAALIRVEKLPKPATPKCTDPVPPKPEEEKPGPPKGLCNLPSSRDWQITGVGAGSPPVKTGVALLILLFRLDQKGATGNVVGTRIIQFQGIGPGLSAGLPITIALPSATPFRTNNFVYFEDFQGQGLIREVGFALGAGFSSMHGLVPPRTEPLDLDLSGWQLGFTVGGQVIPGAWAFGPTGQICAKP
jgi:outer membrane protein OmpA-like peptidoglycan-associated protein